jgi:uncharacterized membrane protein
LLHPLREFCIKGTTTPEGITLAVVIQFWVLAGLHTWFEGHDPWSAFQVWPMMLISGLAILFYYWCIVMTYRSGDLSVYYPITRSSPLFVVIVGFFLFGHQYSASMLAGIVLVLIGAFLLQYRPGSRLFSQPGTLTVATLAMCANGVIALADAEAMKEVEPAAYMFVQYIFLVPAMTLIFLGSQPAGRTVAQQFFAGWARTPGYFLTAGTASYISYLLILMAFQLGANVAAVSAVRQISIPFSVVMGCLIFNEQRITARLAWSMLLGLGVVTIIFSR